jgi:lipopolysaccharide/colanic/teichoic acid biosynthesis glycosyltransferase
MSFGLRGISFDRPEPTSMAEAKRWDWQRRILEMAGALIGLGLSMPVLLPAMAAVRLTMGSPVLFRQMRPGRHERPFAVVKLRTMHATRDEAGNLLPPMQRLTGLGRLLRRLSIDELPQLWNVLKGDMSLVGPRPLRCHYLPYYTPRERTRHLVRPGITGLAQISGRNSLAWEGRLELDAEYVERRSFALDSRILFETLVAALTGDGADYPDTMVSDFAKHRRRQWAGRGVGRSAQDHSPAGDPGDGTVSGPHGEK